MLSNICSDHQSVYVPNTPRTLIRKRNNENSHCAQVRGLLYNVHEPVHRRAPQFHDHTRDGAALLLRHHNPQQLDEVGMWREQLVRSHLLLPHRLLLLRQVGQAWFWAPTENQWGRVLQATWQICQGFASHMEVCQVFASHMADLSGLWRPHGRSVRALQATWQICQGFAGHMADLSGLCRPHDKSVRALQATWQICQGFAGHMTDLSGLCKDEKAMKVVQKSEIQVDKQHE
jgi:hypothetical protein